MSKVGNFSINVWRGYPAWCIIKHNEQELKFTHMEIADLEYAIKKIKQQAIANLPEQYKDEVV